MWNLTTGSTYPSSFFFQENFGAHLASNQILVGGIFRKNPNDVVTRLLQFDISSKQWSEFSPQGGWNQPFG